MNEYESKKQDRIDRYSELADKHQTRANSAHEQARKMGDVIPFGQPILVGHHSEKRDRNYRNRIQGTFERGIDHQNKANYYREKAHSAEKNDSISSDDPDAITKLKEKLEELEIHHARMKDINKIARMKISPDEKHKLYLEYGIKSDKLLHTLMNETKPFEGWQLSNSSANMRTIKQRIEQLERTQDDVTTTTTIGDIEIVDNVEDNRLQIFFPGIPPQETRTKLKQNGFRWSPSNKCWQAYRSKTIDQAKYIVGSC